MLGILLLYFIGKHFYQLAFEYDKHEWTYAILSIVVYYVGTAFAGVFLLFFYDDPADIAEESDLFIGLLAIPFGLLACYLFHLFLLKKWNREEAFAELDNDILDSDFIDNENEEH